MDLSKQTRTTFFLYRLFVVPFWGLFSMIPFILLKDLEATPWQIATVIALKPAVSLLSPYWVLPMQRRPSFLVRSLSVANVLRFIPFLLFPFFSSVAFLIFAFGWYMAFTRAMIPAWMETIRRNVDEEQKSQTTAWGSLIDFSGMIFLPFLFGPWLDAHPMGWKILLLFTALLGISASLLLLPLSLRAPPPKECKETKPLSHWLFSPWQEAFVLLARRPDFLWFQLGFMFGGAGIMIGQPYLPDYCIHTLHLSYTNLLWAIAACKGIGFVVSSSLWIRKFHFATIFSFCGFVTLFAAIYSIGILLGTVHILFFYGAFVIYGVMQSGSELSWHMSGPAFSQNEESSLYSLVNVLTVGLRGLFVPYLGALLCANGPTILPFLWGAFLSLFGTFTFLYAAKIKSTRPA